MSAPPDPGATPLSDADREQLCEALARHHAAGRLTIPQLEARVAVVFQAESREQAAGAISDLPALVPEPGAARASWWRARRHGESDAPDAGWVPTPERFRDPKSKRIMRVWIDPATQERHYIAEQS